MAKQGQHKGDAHDQTKAKGPNHPSRSQTITTGTPKKRETYDEQRFEHRDPHRQAQAARNDWNEDTRDQPTTSGSTRARDSSLRSGRSGSDSNASSGSRGH